MIEPLNNVAITDFREIWKTYHFADYIQANKHDMKTSIKT
jgi:hypothetical protein